jgi:hypothetical protein
MLLTCRCVYGYSLFSPAPLIPIQPDGMELSVLYGPGILARLKLRSPIHDSMQAFFILNKDAKAKSIDSSALKKISGALQEQANKEIETSYLSFWKSCYGDILDQLQKKNMCIISPKQFLSLNGKDKSSKLNQTIKEYLKIVCQTISEQLFEEKPYHSLLTAKFSGRTTAQHNHLKEMKEKMTAVVDGSYKDGTKKGTFYTTIFSWDTKFYFQLQAEKEDFQAFSNFSIIKFYLHAKTSRPCTTLDVIHMGFHEIEILFDFMTSMFITDDIRDSYMGFLNSLKMDTNHFHPFWVSFRIMRPCYALASYLSEKYMEAFFAKDNPPSKANTNIDAYVKHNRHKPMKERLNTGFRLILLKTMMELPESLERHFSDYLAKFENNEYSFATIMKDYHKKEMEYVKRTYNQDDLPASEILCVKSNLEAFIMFYPYIVSKYLEKDENISQFFAGVQIDTNTGAINILKKEKKREPM